MKYKIKSIKHSGTYGERNSDRKDGKYPERIGRIIDFEPTEYEIEFPLILKYLELADGSDYSNRFLRCSKLVNISSTINDEIVLAETNNTIYEFERI